MGRLPALWPYRASVAIHIAGRAVGQFESRPVLDRSGMAIELPPSSQSAGTKVKFGSGLNLCCWGMIMKARELAAQLMRHPDFEVDFSFMEEDGSMWGIALRTFRVNGVGDVGHSEKVIKLDGTCTETVKQI